MKPIKILMKNNLIESKEEAELFQEALSIIIRERDANLLPELHMVFNDNCESDEIMFGLIHYLETFDATEQIPIFLNKITEMVVESEWWTTVLTTRILNDKPSTIVLEETIRGLDNRHKKTIKKIMMKIFENKEEPLRSVADRVLKSVAH